MGFIDNISAELARLRRENDALRAERDEWKRRALENSAQLVRDAFEQGLHEEGK